jgi:hypothetical protein
MRASSRGRGRKEPGDNRSCGEAAALSQSTGTYTPHPATASAASSAVA